ncbi:MAG: DUF4203 domain-containing protein [Balneolaceae bacterium]|nr:DUF4203 domain-containing protein [Balneolaceae bacterium]
MDFTQEELFLLMGLSVIIGPVLCFFGYRLFKFVLGLIGFIIGGALTIAISQYYIQNENISLILGMLGGFIGASLMVPLYFAGVFILGSLFGSLMGIVLYSLTGSSPDPVAMIIMMIIMGVVAVAFEKFMIILSTAFAGAWSMLIGITYFIAGTPNFISPEQVSDSHESYIFIFLLAWLAVGILGVLVQYRNPGINHERS